MYFAIIAYFFFGIFRAVQFVQTAEQSLHWQYRARITVIAVRVIRVEYELLITVVIIVGYALSALRYAPSHCRPLVERKAYRLTGDDERDKLLIDGIAYSLYSKTGFPKSVGIGFSGLPYSYKENAEFIKDVYIRADMLAQDIEEAYSENKEEIKIIDDTEEEAVSDEPVVSVKHTEQVLEKPNHPLYPMYEQYKKAQKTNPNAIVF